MKKNLLLIFIILLLIPFTTYQKKGLKEKKTNESIKVKVLHNSREIIIDLEEYIIGVVAAEMPASFHIEALKAQSVAARTFAYKKIYIDSNYVLKSNKNDQCYISIEEMKEKWKEDFNKYYSKIKTAVLSTQNLIITSSGKPISSYYFSISNGFTEASESVFNELSDTLISVESSWDKNNKNYEKTIQLQKEVFCNLLNIKCNNIIIDNIKKSKTNHIKSLEINNKKFTGVNIRNLLSLRSTDFSIDIKDNVSITTRGYGHGVGMSQHGANYLARNDKKYKEILQYYYTNIEISNIYE